MTTTCDAATGSLLCTLDHGHRGRHHDKIRGATFWLPSDVARLDAEARESGEGYVGASHGVVLDAVAPSGREVAAVVHRGKR